MKKSTLLFILAGLFTLTATQAWSNDTRIVNYTKYKVDYEVYVVTLSSTAYRLCKGVTAAAEPPGERNSTCKQDLYCFTRLNAKILKGNKDGSDHPMDTGYLGAQCWNHKIDLRQRANGDFYWDWSLF